MSSEYETDAPDDVRRAPMGSDSELGILQPALSRDPSDPPETEAERLVAAAIGGDREAFGQLYHQHAHTVYRYALFRLGEPEVAGDVMQDTFIRAYRAIGSLRGPATFRGWLLRIANRQVANHLRTLSRRPRQTELPERSQAMPVPLIEDPGEEIERSLKLHQVLEASKSLTELQQQVIALRFVSGLSVNETAAIMRRSPVAVRNLQFHAIAALRRMTAVPGQGSGLGPSPGPGLGPGAGPLSGTGSGPGPKGVNP